LKGASYASMSAVSSVLCVKYRAGYVIENFMTISGGFIISDRGTYTRTVGRVGGQ